jgi:hypothetical protein
MKDPLLCHGCGSAAGSTAAFCGQCGVQLRCRQCQEILSQGARVCEVCGTPAVQYAQALSFNTLDVVETEQRRSVHARFSDVAVQSLSETLSALLVGRTIHQDPPRPAVTGRSSTTGDPQNEPRPMEQELLILGPETSESGSVQPVRVTDPNGQAEIDDDLAHLQKVFRLDPEKPRLLEPRLKATSQLDAARRVVYLYLHAQELLGHEGVSRERVNAVLRDAGLYDSNSATWIGKSPDLLVDGDVVSLRVPGRERARVILSEVVDPAVPNKWTLGSTSAGGGTKPSKASRADGGGKAGHRKDTGSAKRYGLWLSRWKALDHKVNGHSILEKRSLAERGILGLWAIRTSVGDEDGKVVSRDNLASFLYEAFEIKVDGRSLGRALESESARGKVLKVRGGGYQILPPGMEYARQMAGLVTGTEPAAGNSANGVTAGVP